MIHYYLKKLTFLICESKKEMIQINFISKTETGLIDLESNLFLLKMRTGMSRYPDHTLISVFKMDKSIRTDKSW